MTESQNLEDVKLALVVVDTQNKFMGVSEGLTASFHRREERIKDAIRLFRSTGNPVIFVYYTGAGHGTNTEVCNPEGLAGGITAEESDMSVCKDYMNSFRDSELSVVLRKAGCEGVVLTGLVANYCVLATYFGAYDNGFRPFMLHGGIAAIDEETVESVERICNTVSLADLRNNIHFR